MKYVAIFLDTFSELAQHKLRTLLTLLGMIFGVGAVIGQFESTADWKLGILGIRHRTQDASTSTVGLSW